MAASYVHDNNDLPLIEMILSPGIQPAKSAIAYGCTAWIYKPASLSEVSIPHVKLMPNRSPFGLFSGLYYLAYCIKVIRVKPQNLSVSVFCCSFASASKLAFADTSVAVLDSLSGILFSTRGMYDFEVAYFPPMIFPCSITFEPFIKPIVWGLSWGDKLMFGKRIRCSFIPAVNRPCSSLIFRWFLKLS